MLHGTPEQKAVASHLLEKLATADAQVSGKNAVDLAADLAAKLASTAWKEVEKELQDTNAKASSPRHMEAEAGKGPLGGIFVSLVSAVAH